MAMTHKDAKEYKEFLAKLEEDTSMANPQLVVLAGIGVILMAMLESQGGVEKPTKEDLAEEKAAEDAKKAAEAPPPPPEPEHEETHKIAAHRIEKKK